MGMRAALRSGTIQVRRWRRGRLRHDDLTGQRDTRYPLWDGELRSGVSCGGSSSEWHHRRWSRCGRENRFDADRCEADAAFGLCGFIDLALAKRAFYHLRSPVMDLGLDD